MGLGWAAPAFFPTFFPLMKTIIALVDFSDVTQPVLDQAVLHARTYGARLILVHVVPAETAVVEFGIASPTLMQPPSERRIERDYNERSACAIPWPDSGVQVSAPQLEQADMGKVMDLCQHLTADLNRGRHASPQCTLSSFSSAPTRRIS